MARCHGLTLTPDAEGEGVVVAIEVSSAVRAMRRPRMPKANIAGSTTLPREVTWRIPTASGTISASRSAADAGRNPFASPAGPTARDPVRSSPDRAIAMLDSVAETGRRALAETGRLHLIREESGELGLPPARGLADLPTLLDEMRSAGLTVEASVSPPAVPLPGGVDVSAHGREAVEVVRRTVPGRPTRLLIVEAEEFRSAE